MIAGHIAHGGNILGEAKDGEGRGNDKDQWWEAAASEKIPSLAKGWVERNYGLV